VVLGDNSVIGSKCGDEDISTSVVAVILSVQGFTFDYRSKEALHKDKICVFQTIEFECILLIINYVISAIFAARFYTYKVPSARAHWHWAIHLIYFLRQTGKKKTRYSPGEVSQNYSYDGSTGILQHTQNCYLAGG